MRRPVSGRVGICGVVSEHANPRSRRASGLAYIPADRERVGLSLSSQVWENMTVGHLPEFSRGVALMANAARRRARELIRRFDVRGARESTPAASLSGGNQQKVQLARELTRQARVVIAEQPSRGVDIGAIEAIHRVLVDMRESGCAVFVISADIDEIFSLSDRILVMYRGRIVADLVTDETDVEAVGRLMGGLHEHAEAAAESESGGQTGHVH
jgi:simple sugar transport system ATP-binding protein